MPNNIYYRIQGTGIITTIEDEPIIWDTWDIKNEIRTKKKIICSHSYKESLFINQSYCIKCQDKK